MGISLVAAGWASIGSRGLVAVYLLVDSGGGGNCGTGCCKHNPQSTTGGPLPTDTEATVADQSHGIFCVVQQLTSIAGGSASTPFRSSSTDMSFLAARTSRIACTLRCRQGIQYQ
jgi:hypothetical protein